MSRFRALSGTKIVFYFETAQEMGEKVWVGRGNGMGREDEDEGTMRRRLMVVERCIAGRCGGG